MRRLAAPLADCLSVRDGTGEHDVPRDPLTGLDNARVFAERIDRLIGMRSDADASFAVILFDMDGFKPISDLFGRSAGDRILQQAASRLYAMSGSECTVARIGGDQFGVILSMAANEKEVAGTIRILIEALAEPYDVRFRTARLTASAGCSLFQPYADTTELLLNKAETALYEAKRKGRGQFELYSVEMEKAAKKATRIEQALRRAIAADEVQAHFQPIVDLATRRIVGFEALARWTDLEIGSVEPAIFIPIAEERGIIDELAGNILRKATLAANDWPADLYLSFNLSPSQLVDRNTARQILGILESTNFDPRRLEIEITETGLMTDPASAVEIIEELRNAGMRIALDDFGTGQSSLGRLRDFCFDRLKIDRSFVSSMLEDQPSEHIVRAIVAMCEGLRIDVVAEGIEVEAQADFLIGLGCSNGQGLLFGEPRNAQSTLQSLCDREIEPPATGILRLAK